ncbi:bifunctional phosphopantothenoylcysteine decarboxylase/phosphopantothenate--cysteine ligase CoaBC [Proteinivorax hydrogeniformans]|uniref:Coenzyme A biosynthesis bifunctional protein CoaBC n=1 Tax=Proteinivorax hydrogeniformans TaxID=1826727 RepID=A0AAU8HPK8_9FIRM
MSKKTVVLGVTGGIAAYKSAEIVSRLKKQGYDVFVVLTGHGQKFITKTTFQSISQNQVYTDMFDIPQHDTEHIALAKRADVFVVAPATANILGKVACGIADDLLTTTLMAVKSPVIFAPAMNTAMYENKVVQQNIKNLEGLGYHFIKPQQGRLACGDVGKGKMAEPSDIVEEINGLLSQKQALKGKNILVTAGPTQEPIDPFRFITNHSSGKMGYAIAETAKSLGANVTLISGPTHLEKPTGVEYVPILTADDMLKAVKSYAQSSDALIMSAAISDYAPKMYHEKKVKKKSDNLTLELTKTPDILQYISTSCPGLVKVGFAAETDNIIEYAKEKLIKKKLDLIVANDISDDKSGFKSDTNQITIISEKEVMPFEIMSKHDCAKKILDKVINLIN